MKKLTRTTRNVIQGIYNCDDTQIIFVDTPGIHKPNHKLGRYLNKQAYYSMDDVDVVLFLTSAKEKLGPGDQYILERLRTNIDTLLEVITSYLPDEIRYYGEDEITNKPISFLISEIVREKVFRLTSDEIPHSLTCITERIQKNKNSYTINVCIIVDRDALKKIIIGTQGAMVKKIGMQARPEIEALLGTTVYLEL